MEPTTQQIHDLRNKFFQKIDEEHRDFHPKDLHRVRTDDFWLRRFLLHHELSIKDSLDMLVDTCEWRNSNGVNEINEQNVNIDYLREGSLFVHGKDKDGKSLMIFKCKKHVKGQKDFEDLKKIVMYWFERIERNDKGDQMTLFFDMADTGLSNMDMEYTKYLINLCKQYYPYFLNYILIFEMPWALNAAFKIIKGWLPAKAVQKIKFVNKTTLKDYVDVDQSLVCWGGTDPYEFSFDTLDGIKTDDNRKKVHFADINCNDSPRDSTIFLSPTGGLFSPDGILNNAGGKVRISPSDTITFMNDGLEMIGRFTVANNTDGIVAYKVKTTSPGKFRVKPSQGFLERSANVVIAVTALGGYTISSILRDKFQIMAFSIDNVAETSTNDLNELWKNVDIKKVEQQRLKCNVACSNGVPNPGFLSSGLNPGGDSSNHGDVGTVILSVNQLHKKVDALEGQMWQNKILMFANLLLMLIFLGYFVYSTEFIDADPCSSGQ